MQKGWTTTALNRSATVPVSLAADQSVSVRIAAFYTTVVSAKDCFSSELEPNLLSGGFLT